MPRIGCRHLIALALPGPLLLASPSHAEPNPAAYNVVWDSPSADHHGSMPLGNGDIAVNAWIEPTGDLVFYIAKTDSWDDNGRLVKVGKVRVQCDPPLVASPQPFRQELDLLTGTLRVQAAHQLALWVDAHHPVIEIEIVSTQAVTATASTELWRTNRYTLPSIEASDVMLDRSRPRNMHAPTIIEPDTLLTGLTDRVGWYHHNGKSVGPAQHAETQDLVGCPRPEPLLHRTFGALVTASAGHRLDDTRLRTARGRSARLSVHVLTRHPATPAEWTAAAQATAARVQAQPVAERRAAHARWWQAFWGRSWIQATQSADRVEALFPANAHALRVGQDAAGGNRFRGKIGRTKMPESLAGTFTLEAEVEAAAGETGRIFDKITPGGSDGFLLDAAPGNSLRLIVGSAQHVARGALPAGQHTLIQVRAQPAGWQVTANGQRVLDVPATAARDDAALVSQMYALQRWITACAGRGRYPIKFNGSLFTVPHAGGPGDADYRRWGPGYWWQNTRLPYISACASGDTELMEPLFRLYVDDLLPVNRYRTQRYFGFEDAAYYIECLHFWGDVFNESYGWTPRTQRKDPLQQGGWHKWEWVAGPELVYMMLDAWEHTGDEALLRQRILPTARAVLRFFDHYYPTNAAGRLVMHPAQALETWWDCTNPMPEVAGLRAVTARLLALPAALAPSSDRAFWAAFLAKLPDLPTRETPSGRALAPAERFAAKRNIENPELYGVFPFRLCSFNRTNATWGLHALQHRWDRGHAGWRQDDIFMAYLGLTQEARKGLVARARTHHAGSRFPAFWGPNYDWVPDQDHGGVLMKTYQAMLLQAEPAAGTELDGKIYLLPAWPADWDVSFKLHAPRQTVVQGEFRGGRVVALDVQPAARRNDVILPAGIR